MARSMGMMGSMGASSSSVGNWATRRKLVRDAREVKCGAAAAASVSLSDQYQTLRVTPGASEKEVKRAFRKLALQYHPDVCKGSNCDVQFHRINEAYREDCKIVLIVIEFMQIVMSSLRRAEEQEQWGQHGCGGDGYSDEETSAMYDPNWELWEEWMGWEGAGIRDYSSHINPYN